jgi:pimeloyl-ACP methyl ester carboxylesterase
MQSTLERFDFGGPAQWALVRGGRPDSPILLVVQAGPGFPLIHEADDFERRLRLEEDFRVVYWDQRGTGKSFAAQARAPLALETLVGDVRAMIRALCERFAVARVDVLGLSFGASLALLACREEGARVRSLTCVGPDVNLSAAEHFAYDFALAEAERRGHARALRALRAIGAPPHADSERFMARVKWVANFGGIQRGRDFGGLLRQTLWRLWRTPHYGLRDMLGALRGMTATQARILPALRGFDLLASPWQTSVPTAVFQGRHDAAAPPALAVELARHIGAELYWFEASAHSPHEEEPRQFREKFRSFVASAA